MTSRKPADTRSQQGFSFVTIAPRSNIHNNPALQRIKSIQDAERSVWKGLKVEESGKAGVPLNTKQAELSGFLYIYDLKSQQLLQDLQTANDQRPPLIYFEPVAENQIVRDGPPRNQYTKGNFTSKQDMLYRIYKTDGRIVRSTLELQGFRHTDSHDWNIIWTGSSGKQYLYEGLNEHQRINHFPSSFEITRKDRMCNSIMAMQEKYGRGYFDFIPETFVLPEEFSSFYQYFHKEKKSMWIVKPSCSSRGRGIFLIDNINEVPLEDSHVVSRYVHNPLLINGLKFDLRIYVVVTSFEPLKVYIYPEGLARFATEPYAPGNKKNRYMHLTNYSVNKKNEKFVQNDDDGADDVGSKWSLSALCRHLESVGVDTGLLWSRIYDIIIKSMLAIEPVVIETSRRYAVHRSNCFELFGYDIIIDSNLKPWLLEVNLSPSLATESPLDLNIKGNLIADMLNLVGIRVFDRKKETMNKLRQRLRAKSAQGYGRPGSVAQQNVNSFMGTQKFRNILRETLEEQQRIGNFIRIFPSKGCEVYNPFFKTRRVSNQALYYALYVEMMQDGSAPMPPITQYQEPIEESLPTTAAPPSIDTTEERKCQKCSASLEEENTCQSCLNREGPKEDKMVITGDDVMIEYTARLMHAIKAIREESLKPQWKHAVEKFISHKVWHNISKNFTSDIKVWQKLECRLDEMKERKRRLALQRGLPISNNDHKSVVIRGFSAAQLEEMLRKTSKNVAKELVTCLIDFENYGILTDIIKWLASSQQGKGGSENSSFVNDPEDQKRPSTSSGTPGPQANRYAGRPSSSSTSWRNFTYSRYVDRANIKQVQSA